jgi:RimJ/RimL family protein N-acetyltransferase
MRLEPVDNDLLAVVDGWLADEANHRWLDFGAGVQRLGAGALKIMSQRDIHVLRVYWADGATVPTGLVALSNIARRFGTATLWYVLGDKRQGGRGVTTQAVGQILDLAFGPLALEAVNAWAVETNVASVRVLTANGFRLIGRQRRCHVVEGCARDRLLFDRLATEPGVV